MLVQILFMRELSMINVSHTLKYVLFDMIVKIIIGWNIYFFFVILSNENFYYHVRKKTLENEYFEICIELLICIVLLIKSCV